MAKKPNSSIMNIRDADGTLRKQAAAIGKWKDGKTNSSAGARAAIRFMTQYIKTYSEPIDWSGAPMAVLRNYAVYGYDFTVREPALEEIEMLHCSQTAVFQEGAGELRSAISLRRLQRGVLLLRFRTAIRLKSIFQTKN